MSEVKITQANFADEVLHCDKPVLVDFWATWCGPCNMLAPILSEIAEEYQGSLKVGKINVDEEPGLAQQFQVASIPTVLLFKNGNIVNKSVGFRRKSQVVAMLK